MADDQRRPAPIRFTACQAQARALGKPDFHTPGRSPIKKSRLAPGQNHGEFPAGPCPHTRPPNRSPKRPHASRSLPFMHQDKLRDLLAKFNIARQANPRATHTQVPSPLKRNTPVFQGSLVSADHPPGRTAPRSCHVEPQARSEELRASKLGRTPVPNSTAELPFRGPVTG